mmetsp:Transcript_27072/g.41469  ORF Transcript_27072/g.41469 Transcript_27072/m.41469 type:complete len:81 (-) Transcript_27072:634-876(-)
MHYVFFATLKKSAPDQVQISKLRIQLWPEEGLMLYPFQDLLEERRDTIIKALLHYFDFVVTAKLQPWIEKRRTYMDLLNQ